MITQRDLDVIGPRPPRTGTAGPGDDGEARPDQPSRGHEPGDRPASADPPAETAAP